MGRHRKINTTRPQFTGKYLPDQFWAQRAAAIFPVGYFENLTIANYRYMYLYPSYIRAEGGHICNYCGRLNFFRTFSDINMPKCPGCRQIINERIAGKDDGEYKVLQTINPANPNIAPGTPYTANWLGYTEQRDLIIQCDRCGNTYKVSLPSFLKDSFKKCPCTKRIINPIDFH